MCFQVFERCLIYCTYEKSRIPPVEEDELSPSQGMTEGEKRTNVFNIYFSLVSGAHVNSFGCESVFLTLDSMQKSKKHFGAQKPSPKITEELGIKLVQ